MGRGNRYDFRDIVYDTTASDWAVAGGDLAITTDMSTILTQQIINAMESDFNSMPFVLRNWGNEAKNLDLYPGSLTDDDLPEYKTELAVEEILKGLSSFYRTLKKLSFDFPVKSKNFTFRVDAELLDYSRTSYSVEFLWNGTTKKLSVV